MKGEKQTDGDGRVSFHHTLHPHHKHQQHCLSNYSSCSKTILPDFHLLNLSTLSKKDKDEKKRTAFWEIN